MCKCGGKFSVAKWVPFMHPWSHKYLFSKKVFFSHFFSLYVCVNKKIINMFTLMLLLLQSNTTRSGCPVINPIQTAVNSLNLIFGLLCAPTLNFCWGLGEFVSYRDLWHPLLPNYLNLICFVILVTFLVIKGLLLEVFSKSLGLLFVTFSEILGFFI